MPLAANATSEGYRWPEIGEASGSNSRVPTLRQDWTDWSDISSATESSTFFSSNPLQSVGGVDPDPSLLLLAGTSGDDNSADGEGLTNQLSSGYTALHAPLEAITEDDEVQEQGEAREQVLPLSRNALVGQADSEEALVGGFTPNHFTTLPDFERQEASADGEQREGSRRPFTPRPIPVPTMDTETDNQAVSEFFSNDDESGDGVTGSTDETLTPIVPRQGVPLYRTSTITESIRMRVNQTSLGRTLTSGSSWSVALRHYAPQFEYTLEEWCQTIRRSASLRNAEIIKVDRYWQDAAPYHRFLVFQLRRKGKSQDIFLRLDRFMDPRTGLFKRLTTSSVTPANDRALLTANESRAIYGNTPANVLVKHEASLVFPNPPVRPPKLLDLRHILEAVSLHMKEYRLTRENCWLFCAICLEGLLKKFKGTFMTGGLEHFKFGLSAATDLRNSVYALIPEPEPRGLLRTISTPSYMWSIAVSPDGNHIVSGYYDNSISLWDAQTGTADGEPLEGHTGEVNSVVFSPNGRWIVSGSDDKSIRVWDMETRTTIGEPLRGHSGWVWSVAFSPDGDRIVSGSRDNTIRLWDRATGDAIGEPLQGHTGGVLTATFSPDGRMIASGSGDRTIRLWNAITRKAIGEPLVGHTDSVMSVAFSPNGQHIASGSSDKTIRIWDTATGVQICDAIRGHTYSVESVVYSPDGRYIASGSNDGNILFWDAMTGSSIGAQWWCQIDLLLPRWPPHCVMWKLVGQ